MKDMFTYYHVLSAKKQGLTVQELVDKEKKKSGITQDGNYNDIIGKFVYCGYSQPGSWGWGPIGTCAFFKAMYDQNTPNSVSERDQQMVNPYNQG